MKPDGYSIKDLEILSGIKAHTIRIWEKRYKLLSPDRTDTNIRYYNDEDLRKILNVSLLVNNGYRISKVAKLKQDEIKEKILAITKDRTSESDYVERLLLKMLNFDSMGISQLIDEVISVKGFENAVLNVFFKLFERIGTYWQVGSIFPAQEHYLTNIFRQKIIVEIDKTVPLNKNNLTMLFFLHEKELHEMSLLFYSYMAKKYGYNVIYLGQFVPFDDLVKIQMHLQIDYVFSSFINSISKEDFEHYLKELKNVFHQQKIFITGAQIGLHNPLLPRNVKIVKDYKEFKKYLVYNDDF